MEDPYSPPVNNPKNQPDLMAPSSNGTNGDFDEFLVSDILYVGDLPSSIRDTDIKTLLQHCMPVEVYIKREEDLIQDDDVNYLRFSSPKYADRAYTLYHGFKFTNGATLQLRMYRTPALEPKAHGDILEVTNLATETNDIHRLYDIFRPFGPLQLCTSTGQGMAMVQYFSQVDSKKAIYERDGMLLDGNRITITQLVSDDNDATTADPGALSSSLPTDYHNKQSSHYMTHRQYHQQQSHQQILTSTSKSHIDLMNLYVKNMDPLITNEYLESLFSKFGRIISARVISNPVTQQSRGYGFVSFSREDEAAHALNEMNGQMVYSKPLYISYHEPKKGRNDTNNNNVGGNSSNNNIGRDHMEHSQSLNEQPPHSNIISNQQHQQQQQQQQQQYNSHLVVNLPRKQAPVADYAHPSTVMIEEANPFKDTATIKLPRKKVADATLSNAIPISSDTVGGPTLVSLTTGLSIDSAPHLPGGYQQMQHPTEPMADGSSKLTTATTSQRPPIRRRASIESMTSTMTDTSASIQRQKLTKAIIRNHCCNDQDRIPDIVDLLLTLNRKERSLCLFNADFLQEKVDLALDSLDTFDEDDGDNLIDGNPVNDRLGTKNENDWARQQQQQYLYETVSPVPHVHKPTIQAHSSFIADEKRISRSHNNDTRLPLTPPSSSLSNSDHTSGRMSPAEIDTLLQSIAPMSLHTQKQKLGDIMWNHVKPLAKPLAKAHKVPGFSSKVLVHLLDNVPLAELAHGMNDVAWLSAQVENAANTIHKS